MASLFGSIGSAFGNAIKSGYDELKKKTSSSSSSNKSSNKSSNYSDNYGYDADSDTWGRNNPNQSYNQQQKAEKDYFKTPTGQAEQKRNNDQKEHRDYINSNYEGGFDSYYNTQQQKYNDALARGDADLLARLEADAQRVGYTLAPSQNYGGNYGGMTDGINMMQSAYDQQLQSLMDALNGYQSNLDNIQMPNFDMSGMENIQGDLSNLLNSLQNYQGADSMSMDESMARAYAQLNGLYNANLDKTLEGYNKNAISRGMFGQLPVEALKAQAISETELDKSKATNDLASNLFGDDYNRARQKDADYFGQISQQAGLLNNLYNNEMSQYQNAVNQYLNTVDMANMKDKNFYDNMYRQLDLINANYGATQDQYDRALQEYMTNYEMSSKQDTQAYNRAMDRLNLLGYADEETARILGIPQGTPSQSVSNAKLKGSSSGGSGGSSTPTRKPMTMSEKNAIFDDARNLLTRKVQKGTDIMGQPIYEEYIPSYDEVYSLYLKMATDLGYDPYDKQDDENLLNDLLGGAAINTSKQQQDNTRRNLNEKRVNQ